MDEEEPSIINFGASRDSADSDDQVRCPRCKKFVFLHDTRCEHCGLHFQGEAWQFSPSTRNSTSSIFLGMPRWLIAAITIAAPIAIAFANI